MSETQGSPTAFHEATVHPGDTGGSATFPGPPAAVISPSRWTGGRITALVIGALLGFVAVVLVGAGGTALWADLTKRDGGYLTTDAQEFSSSGSALATEPTDLGAPWIGWLYSPGLLDEVRIRATSVRSGQELFVGIARAEDVGRYLAGVSHTHIEDFWVASASGSGTQTVVWEPIDGSWTVVVMNADGEPRIAEVETDLGARLPALVWVALGVLVAGAIFLAGSVLLISAAVRRGRTERTRAA